MIFLETVLKLILPFSAMRYCPVILSGAQRSRRSGVQLAASQASSSLTNSGGKDASATLSMTKRRTSVASGINFKTAS